MSVSREDLSLKMWQLQEAVQRLRINVRTVHDTKCRLFSASWRKVRSPSHNNHTVCALRISTARALPYPPSQTTCALGNGKREVWAGTPQCHTGVLKTSHLLCCYAILTMGCSVLSW